jgi:acyl carrier protein
MFEQLTQRVIAIIATNQNIPPEQISLESSFEELDIDSLAALSIIADLENEFNISIPNEEALLISNVRQVVENLQKVLSQDSTDTEVTVQREWSQAEIFQ